MARSLEDFTEGQLRSMLRTVEHRLGTSAEQASDFDYARVIAHQLNNQLTVSRLKAEIEALKAAPA